MPTKLDSSIYKGFLKNLEKAMQEKYLKTTSDKKIII